MENPLDQLISRMARPKAGATFGAAGGAAPVAQP